MEDCRVCKYCRYFDKMGHRCKFNAPIAGVKDHDKWPYTSEYEYCGQFELKPEIRESLRNEKP